MSKKFNISKLKKYISFLIKNAISNFYYSNKFIYQRLLRSFYQKRSKKLIAKLHPELYLIINNILEKMNVKEYHENTFWSDAWFLLNMYLKKQPNKFLELGSGVSTLALAYAANLIFKKNGSVGKIISIDENASYLSNIVEANLPNYLNKFVELIHSKVEVFTHLGKIGINYKNIPYQSFDMIYIDGPQFRPNVYADSKFQTDEEHLKNLNQKPFDGDLLKIIHCQSKDCIVIIDQRISTVWTLQSILYKLIKNKKYSFLSTKTVFSFNSKIEQVTKDSYLTIPKV